MASFHCPANRPGRSPPGNRRAARCPAEFRRMSWERGGRWTAGRTRPPPGFRRRHACTPGRWPRRVWCPPGRCCLSAAPASRPAIAGRQGGRGKALSGPCRDAKASFQCRPAIAGRLRQGRSVMPFSGGPGVRRRIRRRVSGGNGRLDWWVASLPATRGIECGTGEPSSVYMAERRAPGRGFEPPRLSHLAVFKTAAFPLCQPGAGGADCRRWTGLSGMRVQRAGV